MVAQNYHSGIIFLKKHVRSRLEHPVRVPHSPHTGCHGQIRRLKEQIDATFPAMGAASAATGSRVGKVDQSSSSSRTRTPWLPMFVGTAPPPMVRADTTV